MRRVFGALLLAFSLIAFIASMSMFDSYTGGYESNERYGGDAYTGIQSRLHKKHWKVNANNVERLSTIVSEGFGWLFLLSSFTMFACGLYQVVRKDTPVRVKTLECSIPYAVPVAAAYSAPVAPVAPVYTAPPQPAPNANNQQ